jgi:hypothetical protein
MCSSLPFVLYHDESASQLAVLLLSPAKTGKQFLSAARRRASDILPCAAGMFQSNNEGQGKGHVDMTDVGVQLDVIEL